MRKLIKYCALFLVMFIDIAGNSQALSDSLKGHYKFDGDLTDFSVEENDITIGSGLFVTDRFGIDNGALELNGTTDSLVFPIEEFAPIDGDFTIGFWYKSNHPEIINLFSSKQFASDTTNNFEIQLSSHNSNYLEFYSQTFYESFVYWNGSGLSNNSVAEGVPGMYLNGQWCHFVITRVAGDFQIYLNHSLTALSINNNFNGQLGDAVDLIFGASPYPFKGAIDDMRFYNRGLDQSEIDLLWFENDPIHFTTVKPTDAYVQGSNVLVFWEYDSTQISDSIHVEYKINGGEWVPAIHSNQAIESYTYLDMIYEPGTTVEVRVTDFNNETLTSSTGALLVSEYDWVEVTDSLPFTARDGSGLLSFQGKMWLLGGWDPPYHPPDYTHSEVWSSIDGENWVYETTAPWPARHVSGWLTSDDAMWVIGGDPQSGCLTDVWKSVDGINWTEVINAIPGFVNRLCNNYAFANNKIWLFGGQQCSAEPLSDVWSSEDGINWTQLPDAPWSGRGMQINSCVDGDGQFWMLGGSNETTRRSYNEVWKSSDGIDWTLVNESAPWRGRYWHTVAWYDDKMWLMGGMATGYEMNDVWYSEDGTEWKELKSTTGNWPAGSRHAQSTTVFDNAVWYMCGVGTNNVWKIINANEVDDIAILRTRENGLKLFPNPAENILTINFSSIEKRNNILQIYNMLGEMVDEIDVSIKTTFDLDISEYSGGVYFVKLNGSDLSCGKFVKR